MRIKLPLTIIAISSLILGCTPNSKTSTTESIFSQRKNPKINTQLQAFPAAIPNGSCIVLKNGKEVAVIFIESQSTLPNESCTFKWFYRNDGIVDFTPGATGVTEKTLKESKSSKIGNLSLAWSGNSPGYGYVYMNPDCYTGLILGATPLDINTRLHGTIMTSHLKGDCLDLHTPES